MKHAKIAHRFELSLRGRLLLLVLLGVVFPLAVLGLFASDAARRTGVALVHTRLREALAETVDEFGRQWIQGRSLLLDLADTRAVKEALDGSGPWVGSLRGQAREEILGLWPEVSSFVVSLHLMDLGGNVVGRLPDALGPDPEGPKEPSATLDYALPVLERFSGAELGTMNVRLRIEGLLPPGFLTLGVAGSILGVFDSRTGVLLAPVPIETGLFSRTEFHWRGEDWVAEERVLGDPPVRFVLAAPIGPVTEPFEGEAQRGAWAIIVTVALSFALVTGFARWLTRPLDKLARAAKSVAAGDLATQVEESGPPGVRDTAQAFNAMSTTLQETLRELAHREAVAAVGEFAADLAHEVRNPLTAIRTDLQRAQGKVLSDPDAARGLVIRAVGAVDRLNATVSDVLRVARSSSVSLTRCDLREPLEAAVRSTEPQRLEANCVLQYEPPLRPVMVSGDPDALERMALNLLLNAVEAVGPGSAVGIRIRDEEADALVSVEFWDQGPGIPEDLREAIFDPFMTTKNGGTGLGLAIARRIARAHGSDLALSVGSGETVFRVHLKKAEG